MLRIEFRMPGENTEGITEAHLVQIVRYTHLTGVWGPIVREAVTVGF